MKSQIQISETVQDVLKENGWRMYEINVVDGQECYYYETALEKYSPAGEPYFFLFPFDGTDVDLLYELRIRAREFDPDKHAAEQILCGSTRRTYTCTLDIVNDAMAIQDMIWELACALDRRMKEANNG